VIACGVALLAVGAPRVAAADVGRSSPSWSTPFGPDGARCRLTGSAVGRSASSSSEERAFFERPRVCPGQRRCCGC